MHSNQYDLIVIGAGAAGLMAAGRAAELGANVLVLERMKRPGLKLLITSNGRCNLTNTASRAEFFSSIYPTPRFLKHAFSLFFNHDIIELLKRHGVATHTEENGRVLPDSERSKDVLNAFVNWTCNNHVSFRFDARVEELIIENSKVIGVKINQDEKKEELFSTCVCICTGGKTYPSTGSTGDGYKFAQAVGHTIVPLKPALIPLLTTNVIAPKLQGLVLPTIKLSCWVNGKKQLEKTGDLLFTHFGLSGPVAINISRFVVEHLQQNNRVELKVDLHSSIDEQTLDQQLINGLNEHGKMLLKNYLSSWMPSRLIIVAGEFLQLDIEKPCYQVNAKERKKLGLFMKAIPFEVTGSRPFKEAMITSGGISTSEIDSKTMESKLIQNLFFAGEVIDLDADTGGYNLQIAWSTGYLAAESVIKKVKSI